LVGEKLAAQAKVMGGRRLTPCAAGKQAPRPERAPATHNSNPRGLCDAERVIVTCIVTCLRRGCNPLPYSKKTSCFSMQKDTSNTRNIAHLFGRSTPEHGRDQKYRTLKGEPWKQESAGQATALPTQQQDQPRSARTVGLELSLSASRDSPFLLRSPSSVSEFASVGLGLSRYRARKTELSPLGIGMHVWRKKKGPRREENVDQQLITTSDG
jgi:hypothetical protein